MWQVSELCTDLIAEAPEYDRFYLANRTLRLDVWLLFRTALNMVGVGRCITLADVPGWAVAPQPDVVVSLNDAQWDDVTVSWDDVTVSVPTAAIR
jgi:hypothetical protein